MHTEAAHIEAFAHAQIGAEPFSAMRDLVEHWDHADIAGKRKRRAVLREFKALAFDLVEHLINLALELALAWLKSQAIGTNENR